jgi:hypothetical protein
MISWICIFVGIIFVTFSMIGEMTLLKMVQYAVGNTLVIVPNAIWIYTSNKLASAALGRPSSSIITGFAISSILACFLLFLLLPTQIIVPEGMALNLPSNHLMEVVFVALPLIMFASLITAIVLVSRRLSDTQESPEAGRGSRIFVSCICFFYIAIGMFFIAPKLKKIKANSL